MVFDNIFKTVKSNNNNSHPMSKPIYTTNLNSTQGLAYLEYKRRKQKNAKRKNAGLVEGFMEAMEASEGNGSNDLSTLNRLMGELDESLNSLHTASTNHASNVKSNMNSVDVQHKHAVDAGEYNNLNYEGCYSEDTDNSVLPYFQGTKTPQQCAQRAHDLGKPVFGMRNSTGPTGECWIGDDLDAAKNRSSAIKTEVVWESDELGSDINQIAVGHDGTVKSFSNTASDFSTGASDTWGDELGMIGNKETNCSFEGNHISEVLSADYGGNCSSDGTDVSQYFASLIGKNQGSVEITASDWGFSVPDDSCPDGRSFNASYTCGKDNVTKTITLDGESNGQTAVFDCTNECTTAPYSLQMKDNGNLVINTSGGEEIWTTNIQDSVGDLANDLWIHSDNNIGDRIESGSIMNSNEFLCSPSGKNIAYIENGKFMVAKSKSSCTANDLYMFGELAADALYSVDTSDISNLGKVGYLVDNTIRNFTSDMLSGGSTFTKLSGFNIDNIEPTAIINDKTLQECKKLCAQDSSCSLFTYPTNGGAAHFYGSECGELSSSSGNFCYGEQFPSLQNRILDSNTDIYVKNPKVTSNDTCETISKGINLNTYNSYDQGDDMSEQTLCGLAEVVKDSADTNQSAYDDTLSKSTSLIAEIEHLFKTSKELQNLRPHARQEIHDKVVSYRQTYHKIMNTQHHSVTVDAQLEDSDLNMISRNYEYVMWSAIAILAVVITTRLVRKKTE